MDRAFNIVVGFIWIVLIFPSTILNVELKDEESVSERKDNDNEHDKESFDSLESF